METPSSRNSLNQWYHFRLVSNEHVSKYCFCRTPQMLNFIEKKKKNYSIIAFVVYGEAIFVQYTQTHSVVKCTHCVEKNVSMTCKSGDHPMVCICILLYSFASDLQCLWFDLSFVILIWSVCWILDIRRIAMYECRQQKKNSHTLAHWLQTRVITHAAYTHTCYLVVFQLTQLQRVLCI